MTDDDNLPNPPSRLWVALRIAGAGLFWGLVCAVLSPLACAMRQDRRVRTDAELDRAHARRVGYDDNDPGVDVDCVPVPIFDVETHAIQPGIMHPYLHPSAVEYRARLGVENYKPTPGISGNACLECGFDAGPYHCANCGAT